MTAVQVAPSFAPVKGLVMSWVNEQPDLVGEGNPLAMGAVGKPLRSAAKGAYAYLYQVGAGTEFAAEGGVARVRLSARVEALTELGAENGANAYANALLRLAAEKPTVRGWRFVGVANVSGPGYTGTGSDLESFLVDADFYVVKDTTTP